MTRATRRPSPSVASDAQAMRSGRSTWNAQVRNSHKKLASAPAAAIDEGVDERLGLILHRARNRQVEQLGRRLVDGEAEAVAEQHRHRRGAQHRNRQRPPWPTSTSAPSPKPVGSTRSPKPTPQRRNSRGVPRICRTNVARFKTAANMPKNAAMSSRRPPKWILAMPLYCHCTIVYDTVIHKSIGGDQAHVAVLAQDGEPLGKLRRRRLFDLRAARRDGAASTPGATGTRRR